MFTDVYPSLIRKKKIKREKRKKEKNKTLGITKLNKIYSMAPVIKKFILYGETRLKQERISGQVMKYPAEGNQSSRPIRTIALEKQVTPKVQDLKEFIRKTQSGKKYINT